MRLFQVQMNIEYWQKRAEEGLAAGLIAMGDCYLRGDSVEQDFVEARRLLSRAHEKGALTGTFLLGTIYEDGLGVPQDVAYAIDLYEQATRIDHEGALLNLARIYRYGKGVQADSQRAAEWYRRILLEVNKMDAEALNYWADEIKEARDFIEEMI